MKILKYTLSIVILIFAIYSCTEDDSMVDISAIEAPSNVTAAVRVTQDNTGSTTITPLGEGAVNFTISFGDGSEASGLIQPGGSATHVYEEGSYEIMVTANGLNGLSTTTTQTVVISFQAPQNLVVTIENDAAVSKKVNVTAEAEFALSYTVDFGQLGSELVSGNNGETVSFIYDEPGTYTIVVTAFSAAIETVQYEEDFVVTEILQPLSAAPTPPSRQDEDVISLFSNSYTLDVNVSSWRSEWSTSTLTDLQISGNDTKFYADADFVGVEFYDVDAVDASQMEFFHLDFWSVNATTFRVKLVDLGGSVGTEAEIVFTDLPQNEWVSINIPMSDFTNAGMTSINSIQQLIFSGLPTNTFDFFIDNVYFYRASTGGPAFDDGLLNNGDFENGSDSWIVGVDDNVPAPVVTEDGNTYYSVNVTAAGQPYAVNVSQKLEIIQGQTYTLTFDAWSDVSRSIISGIGLSGGDFSSTTETINITPTVTNYTLTLSATNFGAMDARVLFDLGAEIGIVNIDNVSLFVATGNLLTNGDFQNGSDPWIVGVDDNVPAPIVTVAGNTYYSVDVTTAGQPFAVNLSQKLEIIQGETYTLSFDAWSNVNRSMIGGIGLSGGDFSNTTETINITSTVTNYTLTLSATSFGAMDARVLFDLGAAVGVVNIDNVVLTLD